MNWRYKIWLIIAGAIFTIVLASEQSSILAVGLSASYVILIALTIKKQFLERKS